jgi:hypothetical protein
MSMEKGFLPGFLPRSAYYGAVALNNRMVEMAKIGVKINTWSSGTRIYKSIAFSKNFITL